MVGRRVSLKPRQRPQSQRFKLDWLFTRQRVGLLAAAGISPTKIMEATGIGRSQVYYWRQKMEDEGFHPGEWGGARDHIAPGIKWLVNNVIFLQWRMRPTSGLQDYVQQLAGLGLKVTLMYPCRLFRSWSWTFKVPEQVERAKFRPDNISYYKDYLAATANIPWELMHFLDEASYNIKDLRRERVLGPAGRPQANLNDIPLGEPTYNTTVLTTFSSDLSVDPFYVQIREQMNDAKSFLDFITDALDAGVVAPGHFIFLDNARIHSANDILPALISALSVARVQLLFMPCYFSELSPAEPVHGAVKNWIRYHNTASTLFTALIAGHANVTMEKMQGFYRHCLNYFDRDYADVDPMASLDPRPRSRPNRQRRTRAAHGRR